MFEAHVDAPPAALPAGVAAGEFRIVGTPSPSRRLRAVRKMRALAGSSPLFGFALHELEGLGAIRDEAFGRLKEAGLDGSPRSRSIVTTSAEALESRDAQACWRCTGTVQSARATCWRAHHAGSRLLSQSAAFRAFAPLPRQSVSTPTTGFDDVKAVALARLLVRDVPSIQVDWPLYGPKLAQVGLTVGADDVDGVAAHDWGVLGRGAVRSKRSGQHPRAGLDRGRAQRPIRASSATERG